MIEKVATFSLITALATLPASAQRHELREDRSQSVKIKQDAHNRRSTKKANPYYGRNMIRMAPITALDIGLGVGIGYERLFGRYRNVGLTLPMNLILEDRGKGYFSGSHNLSATETYLYFTPGLKVYPFGQHRVTYAIGPGLMLGYGGGREWRYNNVLRRSSQVAVKRLRIGTMVNNSVDFKLSRHIHLSLEAGLGIRYLDKERLSAPSYYGQRRFSYPIKGTGQASFSVGFRF